MGLARLLHNLRDRAIAIHQIGKEMGSARPYLPLKPRQGTDLGRLCMAYYVMYLGYLI